MSYKQLKRDFEIRERILSKLYRDARSNPEEWCSFNSILNDLRNSGYKEDELRFNLFYLKSKGFIDEHQKDKERQTNDINYKITGEGIDFVEQIIESEKP